LVGLTLLVRKKQPYELAEGISTGGVDYDERRGFSV